MKRFFLTLFFFSLLSQSFSQDIFLFLRGNRMVTYSPATCTIADVSTFSMSFTDISLHPNGNMYGVRSNGDIYELDITSGNATLEHSLAHSASLYSSMTCDANGTLFIASTDGDLVTYNVASSVENFLGSINFTPEGDLTFRNGELYMGSTNSIVRVNLLFPSLSTELDWALTDKPIWGIVTDFEDCENQNTYAMSGGSSPSIFYSLDFENETITELCQLDIEVYGATSEDEFLSSQTIDVSTSTTAQTCTTLGSLSITINEGNNLVFKIREEDDYETVTSFSNLDSGDYSLFIQDENLCKDTINFTIEDERNPLEVAINNIEAQTCTSQGSISLEVIQGTNLSYVLNGESFPVGTTTINDLEAGDYILQIEDNEGCTGEENFTINDERTPVDVDITSTTEATCDSGGSITISINQGTAIRFRINDGEEFTETTQTDIPAGDYNLTATNEEGCEQIIPFSISNNANPINFSLESTPTSCNSLGSISINIIQGENIRFSLNGGEEFTESIITDLVAGNYSIIGTDDNGCSLTRNITIENGEDPFQVSLSTSSSDCSNNGTLSISVLQGSNLSFQIDNGEVFTSVTQNNLSAGNYTLTITSENGCSSNEEFTIEEDTFDVFVQTSPGDCSSPGQVVATSTSSNLEYSLDNNTFTTNPIFLDLDIGDYTLYVRNQNNCIIEFPFEIEGCLVLVPGAIVPNGNNNNEVFSVLSPNPLLIEKYTVFDRWGNVIYNAQNFSTSQPELFWDGRYEEGEPFEGAFLYEIIYQVNNQSNRLGGVSYVIR